MKPGTHVNRILFLMVFPVAFCRPAAAQTIADTLSVLTCHRFWKTGAPAPGITARFNFPGPDTPAFPSWANVPVPAGDCAEFKFPPGTTFTDLCPVGYGYGGWPNGITVADMVKMRRHRLGIEPLPAPFPATIDVNGDGEIGYYDEAEIAGLMGGNYDALPFVPYSWISFPSKFVPVNPDIPLAGWDCDNVYNPGESRDTIEFTAYKVGDLDGDANPAGPYEPQLTMPAGTVFVPDMNVQAVGSTVLIPVFLFFPEPITGFQVNLAYDTSVVVNLPGLGLATIINSDYWTSGDYTSVGVFSTVPIAPGDIPAGDSLFALTFTVKKPFQVKDAFRINTKFPALWVDTAGLLHPFVSNLATRVSPEPFAGIRVEPPSPNPFHDRSSIRLTLDASASVRLDVFDTTGRMLWSQELRLEGGGEHILDIPGSAVPEGSVSFYRLSAPRWTNSGKLVRL